MFGVLPDRVAPDQLLAAGGRLQGLVPLARLERLAGFLQEGAQGQEAASADLKLSVAPHGRYWLQGRVNARVVVRCERCLGPMEWPLDITIGLYLVPDEAAAGELSEHADYAVVGDNFRPQDLIEDELILALPLVAKHPPGTACGDRVQRGPVAEAGKRDTPFAILSKMKF
jgi:uncharacterized protein